jgi:hypothetical protein
MEPEGSLPCSQVPATCPYPGPTLSSPHNPLLSHYFAQSDCLTADRQGQGDTRLTLTPSVTLNSNSVIMVSDWNCIKYFCVFLVL